MGCTGVAALPRRNSERHERQLRARPEHGRSVLRRESRRGGDGARAPQWVRPEGAGGGRAAGAGLMHSAEPGSVFTAASCYAAWRCCRSLAFLVPQLRLLLMVPHRLPRAHQEGTPAVRTLHPRPVSGECA